LYSECVLYRGYAANATAAAEMNVQNGGSLDMRIKQPRGPVTEQVIDNQLMQLDTQVQTWGRVEKEEVHNLLNLVKKVG